MVKVKVCGIRDAQGMLSAVEAGADWIGLNFAANSKRKVSVDAARKLLALRGETGPVPVGVFVDEANLESIADALGLRDVQLHGDESADRVAELVAKNFKVIKAVRVEDTKWVDRARLFEAAGATVLLDGKSAGSGQTIDRRLLADNDLTRAILAGGLTPENVREIVESFAPYAVDAASGLEVNGLPSPTLIRQFVDRAKGVGLP